MENRLEQLKKDLVVEIKELAQNIAESDSFIGLLSHELKLRALQEKFLVLKFLEQKRLSLEVFDMPIPTREEKQEILEQEGMFEDETPVVFDFNIKEETTQIEVETEEEDEEEKTEEIEIISEEGKEETPVEETIVEEEVEQVEVVAEPEEDSILEEESAVEDENNEEDEKEIEPESWRKEIEESIDYGLFQNEKAVPPIRLDFNDKIGFLNHLFFGDQESMDLVMNTLNRIQDASSSKQYLKDLREEMNWDSSKDEYLERLEELAIKRFD